MSEFSETSSEDQVEGPEGHERLVAVELRRQPAALSLAEQVEEGRNERWDERDEDGMESRDGDGWEWEIENGDDIWNQLKLLVRL